jgi:uncharacterized integral membrane protein
VDRYLFQDRRLIMKYLKFLLAVIIILVVVILLVENHGAFSTGVEFRIDLFTLHYRSPEISIYYIIGISFLFGVLITGLYGTVERFQLKKQIKTLNNSSKEKDKELNSLRNLPITLDNVGSEKPANDFENA